MGNMFGNSRRVKVPLEYKNYGNKIEEPFIDDAGANRKTISDLQAIICNEISINKCNHDDLVACRMEIRRLHNSPNVEVGTCPACDKPVYEKQNYVTIDDDGPWKGSLIHGGSINRVGRPFYSEWERLDTYSEDSCYRGLCGQCSEPVVSTQAREKDDDDVYGHVSLHGGSSCPGYDIGEGGKRLWRSSCWEPGH